MDGRNRTTLHGTGAVLVIGPDCATRPLVASLRHGLDAWPDRLGRVADDRISFAWTDALVIVDPTDYLESANLRLVRHFPGSKLLVTTAALTPADRAALLDRGFDAVLSASGAYDLLTARFHRLLGAPAPAFATTTQPEEIPWSAERAR